MSESKDVARRVADWLKEHRGYDMNAIRAAVPLTMEELEAALDALNITFAPPVPEGSVKVRIAVGVIRGCEASEEDGDAWVGKDGVSAEDLLPYLDDPEDTHRGIVEAWIPPVTPAPTVSGRVV